MRYLAFATDFDGTLTMDGRLPAAVFDSLQKVKASGRKLILVTGRELPELLSLLPEVTIFDRVIAENGAVLYRPETKEERLLVEPPQKPFFQMLIDRGITPLSRGHVVIATKTPQEHKVLDVIREMGLELTVSFNKESVMILPSGVNKATGLEAALKELDLKFESVVGVGDAENDALFLRACQCSVAVANAIPQLKKEVDIVMPQPNGEGVQELLRHLLEDDLKNYNLG